MSKHTEGEWRVLADQTASGDFSIKTQEGYWVAHLYGGLGVDEERANARLIAASPKLLELLQQANHATKGCHTVMWQNAQREVLAEIEGKSK